MRRLLYEVAVRHSHHRATLLGVRGLIFAHDEVLGYAREDHLSQTSAEQAAGLLARGVRPRCKPARKTDRVYAHPRAKLLMVLARRRFRPCAWATMPPATISCGNRKRAARDCQHRQLTATTFHVKCGSYCFALFMVWACENADLVNQCRFLVPVFQHTRLICLSFHEVECQTLALKLALAVRH